MTTIHEVKDYEWSRLGMVCDLPDRTVMADIIIKDGKPARLIAYVQGNPMTIALGERELTFVLEGVGPLTRGD